MMRIITVPDLPAADLTALMLKERGFTHCDPDLRHYDYYRGLDGLEITGRGRRYEVMIWNPGKTVEEKVSPEEVRGHFQGLGAFGHSGALIQWPRVISVYGFFATVPPENACHRGPTGVLSALTVDIGPGGSKLSLQPVNNGWSHIWGFVGFRLVS